MGLLGDCFENLDWCEVLVKIVSFLFLQFCICLFLSIVPDEGERSLLWPLQQNGDNNMFRYLIQVAAVGEESKLNALVVCTYLSS
ncbi:MAG: hypothetical protein KAG12_00015 [Desulfuromusa sp.]|nr:hypothetical protein [Desulfuromusa sp.]